LDSSHQKKKKSIFQEIISRNFACSHFISLLKIKEGHSLISLHLKKTKQKQGSN
jgi:hypothetical protein